MSGPAVGTIPPPTANETPAPNSAALQAAHQLRLEKLLESGRLTPAPSPTPDAQPVASPTPSDSADEGPATRAKGRKRKTHPKPNLASVAEHAPEFLPDAINYIVSVSTRSRDVELENDHNLFCLCSFPTHQAAYDYILRHRLALARHYMQDPKMTQNELDAATAAAGMDELYLGEHTSMEILQVPHFQALEGAPAPRGQGQLFEDHFASRRTEEEHERRLADQANAESEADRKADDATSEGKNNETKAATKAASPKPNNKRRKV